MKKHILLGILLTLSLLMLLCVSALAASSGTCGDNLTWILESGALRITGQGEMYNYGEPNSSSRSPWLGRDITSISFSQGITSIGDNAFNGLYPKYITSVTIPNSVTKIGNKAFYDNTKLTNVTLSNSVTSIGAGAFENCSSLKSIDLPDTVTVIGNSAFYDCSSLESINIPNSVTEIGVSAFWGRRYLAKKVPTLTIQKTIRFVLPTGVEKRQFTVYLVA